MKTWVKEEERFEDSLFVYRDLGFGKMGKGVAERMEKVAEKEEVLFFVPLQ